MEGVAREGGAYMQRYLEALHAVGADKSEASIARLRVLYAKFLEIYADIPDEQPFEYPDTFLTRVVPAFTKNFTEEPFPTPLNLEIQQLLNGDPIELNRRLIQILEETRREIMEMLEITDPNERPWKELSKVKNAIKRREEEMKRNVQETKNTIEAHRFILMLYSIIKQLSFEDGLTLPQRINMARSIVEPQIIDKEVRKIYHILLKNVPLGKILDVVSYVNAANEQYTLLHLEIEKLEMEKARLEIRVKRFQTFNQCDAVFTGKISAYRNTIAQLIRGKAKPTANAGGYPSDRTPSKKRRAASIPPPEVITAPSMPSIPSQDILSITISEMQRVLEKAHTAGCAVNIVRSRETNSYNSFRRPFSELLALFGVPATQVHYIKYPEIKKAKGIVIMPQGLNTHRNLWDKPDDEDTEFVVVRGGRAVVLLNEIKRRRNAAAVQTNEAIKTA